MAPIKLEFTGLVEANSAVNTLRNELVSLEKKLALSEKIEGEWKEKVEIFNQAWLKRYRELADEKVNGMILNNPEQLGQKLGAKNGK